MVSHPPVMTSVVHCVPCSASFFFSFPQFWQTVHHRWPSSGGFVQTQQNKVWHWPCVSGMERPGKLTSICHSILCEIPGVRMTEKPGCGDLSKRSSYSNMGNFLEEQERANCANRGLSIPDAWPLDIRQCRMASNFWGRHCQPERMCWVSSSWCCDGVGWAGSEPTGGQGSLQTEVEGGAKGGLKELETILGLKIL